MDDNGSEVRANVGLFQLRVTQNAPWSYHVEVRRRRGKTGAYDVLVRGYNLPTRASATATVEALHRAWIACIQT